MDKDQIIKLASEWANDAFKWIGFGTVVGMLAKAIMPGRDPGGPVATLAMGIGGTIIGCGILSLCTEGARVEPISTTGFAVGTGGSFLILFFYKLLGGYWIRENEGMEIARKPTRRVVRSGRGQTVYEDAP